jgi:hypothetical protein
MVLKLTSEREKIKSKVLPQKRKVNTKFNFAH